MATHSSILAWRIPGTAEPGGLPAVYGVAQSRTRLELLQQQQQQQQRRYKYQEILADVD